MWNAPTYTRVFTLGLQLVALFKKLVEASGGGLVDKGESLRVGLWTWFWFYSLLPGGVPRRDLLPPHSLQQGPSYS